MTRRLFLVLLAGLGALLLPRRAPAAPKRVHIEEPDLNLGADISRDTDLRCHWLDREVYLPASGRVLHGPIPGRLCALCKDDKAVYVNIDAHERSARGQQSNKIVVDEAVGDLRHLIEANYYADLLGADEVERREIVLFVNHLRRGDHAWVAVAHPTLPPTFARVVRTQGVPQADGSLLVEEPVGVPAPLTNDYVCLDVLGRRTGVWVRHDRLTIVKGHRHVRVTFGKP